MLMTMYTSEEQNIHIDMISPLSIKKKNETVVKVSVTVEMNLQTISHWFANIQSLCSISVPDFQSV
jgi:hypothetical protein